MDWITEPQAWVAFATLTALEIVLGIDNIVFISVLSSRLPPEEQGRARMVGLTLALVGRVVLLLSISWVMGLKAELFEAFGRAVSGRDLILLGGGLFLIAKATHEIHQSLEGEEHHASGGKKMTLASALVQIFFLDLVFSLDSVITAVGMADDIGVMIAAVVTAIVFMMWSARSVAEFIHKHPTVKMLALSFLLLVGVALIVEGLHAHLPRGYIYFAMGFSVFVEMLNLRILRSKRPPVDLRGPEFD
ncbi:MAG: TerC family protein [bacterium]|nr:TerC family protein [bacterium]